MLKEKKILQPPNWPLLWPPAGQEPNIFLGWPKVQRYVSGRGGRGRRVLWM